MKDARYKDLPALVLMTFVLFALKAIWAVLISTGPSIIDELRYALNANAIFALQKYATAQYPPAYSLVLAPAFFFKQWYEGMLVINAFWSSLVVPATWFLARSVGIRKPLIAAFLAALLPMHFVFPNVLFSENLFVPLFVLAVALALRGGKRGAIEALAFGFVLGITHLTKYLFLPALPLLFGAWLYSRSKSNQEVSSGSLPKRYYPALLVLLAYSLVIGIWLYYGRASGFGWGNLFGFGLAPLFGYSISGIKTKTANINSFLMYAVAYTAYVILAWLQVWGIIAIWMSQLSDKVWRFQSEPRDQYFLILVLLLLGCYWLVAVQHSFGAGYNYPEPNHMLGRYLMQLSPIMLVVGVWVLERITEGQVLFRKMKAFIGLCVLAGLASISWWILFNKGIWGLSEGFVNRAFGTVDVIALVSLSVFLLAIVMVFLLMTIIFLRRNDVRFLILPIVVLMLASLVVDAKRMHAKQNGLHYREIAYAAAGIADQEGDTLNVFFDGNGLLIKWFNEKMSFWGVKQKQLFIQNLSTQESSGCASISSPTLLITKTLFDIKPLREYRVNDESYYIYRIDGIDPKLLRPIIVILGKDGK